MDSTTKMEVERILKKGWYRMSQGLGEGGWSQIPNWKNYEFDGYTVNNHDDANETIRAKDDETAFKAFESLYHLEMFTDWEIHEKIVEYRMVIANQNAPLPE